MNKKKILIVDDEPDIREILSYNFRKKEFNVYTANDGQEGIRLAETELPDVIISDILMPEMDGIAMCKWLKKTSSLSQISILFLTAIQDDYKFLHAMHSGADQYLTKPIRFDFLLSIVKDILKNKESKNEKRITHI